MAIGNFQPSPLDGRQETTGPVLRLRMDLMVTFSYCTSVRPECMCRWAIPNSKSRLESMRLSYLYMDQLLCPLRQRCPWCCTNWAEHLDRHQARKPSSTKPSEGFTADGGSWGQRPLAVPFRYGRDAPRSGDLAIWRSARNTNRPPPCPVLVSSCCKICSSQDRSRVLTAAASASTQSSAP